MIRKGDTPVTVCVATLCQLVIKGQTLGPMVIGASDRMLTAGDVEFEPQQAKILALTNSVAAMVSGDMAIQSEILQGVQTDIADRIRPDPEKWIDVRFAAETYVRRYDEAKSYRANRAILTPLGLDKETFISRQKSMTSGLVRDLAKELLNFADLGVQALIVGIDRTGAHIFSIDFTDGGEGMSCEDAVGFAAIGIGQGHANSELMASKHTRTRRLPETLYLTYAAKKRAEVAPGVGKATDMFTIGPLLGQSSIMTPEAIGALESAYNDVQRAIENGMQAAMGQFNEDVERTLGEAIDRAKATTPPEQAVDQVDAATEAAKEATGEDKTRSS